MSSTFGLERLPDPLPVAPTSGPVRASVSVPGSKSITNRALVCAALAGGDSTLTGVLASDDTYAMVTSLWAVGIEMPLEFEHLPGDATAVIAGVDGHVPPARKVIDTRQSGTTSRFVLPMLALGSGRYEVTCHPQMQERPMVETFTALRALGTEVDDRDRPGHLPATVEPGPIATRSIELAGDVSSQFLSGLLMIGPCLPDGLRVDLTTALVSRPYVDLTIHVMAAFGARVDEPDERTFVVAPGRYRATPYRIEPDASAASYPLAAAVLAGGAVSVDGLGSGALQGDGAFADVLAQMGATVTRTATSTTVTAPDGPLRGGTFDFTHLSDTAQTLAVLAPFADSPVTITGIGFIRRKEIDRIAAVATELRRAGVRVDEDPDGWTIHPGPVGPVTFETYDDHRMAMSFALLGLRVPGIAIAGPACVAKTFPGYWEMLDQIRASSTGR